MAASDENIEVFCSDDIQRHPGHFATLADALDFAHWGHCCDNVHAFQFGSGLTIKGTTKDAGSAGVVLEDARILAQPAGCLEG